MKNKTKYLMPLLLISFLFIVAAPTIIVAQVPSFTDHPAKVVSSRPKPVRLTTRNARMFRTRLREANRRGVNFAGRYIIATWGCGTGCAQGAVIDSRTGRVYFPKELWGGFGPAMGVSEAVYSKYDVIDYRPDSSLLILNGWGAKKEGVRFLVWNGNRFRLVKFLDYSDMKSEREMRPGHRKAINGWLAGKGGWRLANMSDYDSDLMDLAKKEYGAGFKPFYLNGDFNRDSVSDFAAIVISSAGKWGVAVFNGPVSDTASPSFFSDELEEEEGVFFKDKLMVGPYASEGSFFLVPNGRTYRVEVPEMGM